MDNPNDITVLSLCTGYGGLELGLHRALGRPLRVVAVEIEAFAEANLVAKAEEGKLAIEALYPDLKTFPAGRFSGCFDFILAGYPCSPFSVAGNQQGESDPRHLWPYIREHIKTIRPLFVFCENVFGHVQLGFDEVYRSLAGMGYSVESVLCSAAELNGSFTGRRLFFMATANSLRKSQSQRSQFDERRRVIDGSEAMAATKGPRLPNGGHGRTQEARTEPADSSSGIRGVAWQGQEQYDWEEPRTVESGMGRTVDGFRSRVDELRLLGNGVVPAQAELAFRTLMERMIQAAPQNNR